MTEKVNLHENSFNTHKTLSSAYRRKQLENFVTCLEKHEEEFVAALQKDLKSKSEAILEVKYCISEAIRACDNLDSWMKIRKVEKSLIFQMDKAFLKPEPLGVVLILSPWNYPLTLALEPLIGAIAAGCGAILKPSEISANTGNAICTLMSKYLDSACYSFVSGGPEVAQELITFPFDLIFYTGGPFVGKKVLEAAAKNLTPVILELGGKSPCIVSRNTDLDNVVGRISWFVKKLQEKITSQFGNDIQKSADYARIINHRNFDRLVGLLEEVKDKVVFGGIHDREDKFISPTLIVNPSLDSNIMKEEIFGPLLPIIAIDSINEAVNFINQRDKPLALYVFSKDSKQVEYVLDNTSSGSVCVNDVVMQILLHSLPFGGVGTSGMGKYHGKKSFDAFSHEKSVLWKHPGIECLNDYLRYAPHNPKKMGILSALSFLNSKSKRNLRFILTSLTLTASAIGLLVAYRIKGGF